MDLQHVDEQAVVTGSTAGIGFAIAEALAKEGAIRPDQDSAMGRRGFLGMTAASLSMGGSRLNSLSISRIRLDWSP